MVTKNIAIQIKCVQNSSNKKGLFLKQYLTTPAYCPICDNKFQACKNFKLPVSSSFLGNYTELGRNNFAPRGPVVWNSLARPTRDLAKVDTLEATLKCNKTRLNKIIL